MLICEFFMQLERKCPERSTRWSKPWIIAVSEIAASWNRSDIQSEARNPPALPDAEANSSGAASIRCTVSVLVAGDSVKKYAIDEPTIPAPRMTVLVFPTGSVNTENREAFALVFMI